MARGDMEICSDDHDPIVYTGRACPVCELKEEVDELISFKDEWGVLAKDVVNNPQFYDSCYDRKEQVQEFLKTVDEAGDGDRKLISSKVKSALRTILLLEGELTPEVREELERIVED